MKRIFTLFLIGTFLVLGVSETKAQCDYTLQLYDSYGDGWSGNTIDVEVNGTNVGNYTIASGGSALSVPITGLNTGDVVGIRWNATGTWWSENSWTLENSVGVGIHTEGASGAPSTTMQNFTVSCPPCTPPSALTASNITSSSADISWTVGASDTFYVEYGVAGFTAGSGTTLAPIVAPTNTVNLSGLNPSTNYQYNIMGICPSGDSLLAIIGSFTTGFLVPNGVACTTGSSSVIFSEDFERNPPMGWTGTFSGANADWRITGGNSNSSGTGPQSSHSGNMHLEFEGSGNTGTIASAITPPIDLTNVYDEVEMSFWMHAFGDDMGTFNIGVGTSVSGPFTNVFSFSGDYQTAAADSFINIAVDLTPYIGQTIYLNLTNSAASTWHSDIAIDLIEITTCVTCPAPTNLTTSNITHEAVDLAWTTGGASAWIIEYGPTGFTPGSGTMQMVGTNPYTLSGLMPNTVHDIYVRDFCAVADSSTRIVTQIQTTCPPAYVAPYFYDVETATPVTNGVIGDCWSSNPAGPLSPWSSYIWNIADDGNTPSPATGAEVAYSGNQFFYTEASGGSPRSVAELITPNIDKTSLTADAVMFRYHMFGLAMGDLYIDLFDGTTWTAIDSIKGQQQTNQADDWLFHTTDITAFPDTIQVRLRAVKGSAYTGDISIDNFRVDNMPTCFTPSNLMDSVIGGYSAHLAWTTGGSNSWLIEYGPTGFRPGTGTYVSTSSNPYILTGLTPDTEYDWYIQDICGTDTSWQSPASTFRTASIVFCDSTNNFTYCYGRGGESVVLTYSSEDPNKLLHLKMNSGLVRSYSTLVVYDGPNNTYPVLYSATSNTNTTGIEFTSTGSVISFYYNSSWSGASACSTPLDFDINCCENTTENIIDYFCMDSSYMLADGSLISSPGAYQITIPNVLGCDSTISYLLSYIPDSTTATGIVCAGSNYTFADGTSTATAGTFVVTVSNALGCDSTITYSITPATSTSSSMAAAVCQGDSYRMPDGAMVNTAGAHTATLTNAAGCDSIITVNLTLHAATSETQNVSICQGDIYELSDGVEVSTAGTYTSATVNPNGCVHTITTNLSIVQATASSSTVELCGAETYTLLNGNEVSQSGEYNVMINNTAGCDSVITVYVSKCNAIGDLDSEVLSIYPNPAQSRVVVAIKASVLKEATTLKVVDIAGKIVLEQTVNKAKTTIDVEDLTQGTYFIVLKNQKGSSVHKLAIAR